VGYMPGGPAVTNESGIENRPQLRQFDSFASWNSRCAIAVAADPSEVSSDTSKSLKKEGHW
jgi:hypothetical protein